jgi:putative transposase
MQLRDNYGAYPDATQRRALAHAFGCARVVWNDCLRDRREAHAAGLPYVKSADLSRPRITHAKRTEERAWLAEVSAVVLQQSLRDLDTAYKNFFDSLKGKRQGRKVGPPRYKSKKDTRQSIRLNTNAFSLLENGTVYLAKVGNLKVKGSKNRAKARVKVARQHASTPARQHASTPARQHARVADRRRDWHHRASTRIIRDNQAVYVEDLAVSGLARTRLAKSVYDAGWSAFVGMLEYKAVRHGRTFAKADRVFPSSQVCSACGFRDGPKPLHVREWTCGECGTVHDRDHNAARNVLFEGRRIVAAGRAETSNASWSAGKTRARVLAQRGEAGSPRKGQLTQAGTPGR